MAISYDEFAAERDAGETTADIAGWLAWKLRRPINLNVLDNFLESEGLLVREGLGTFSGSLWDANENVATAPADKNKIGRLGKVLENRNLANLDMTDLKTANWVSLLFTHLVADGQLVQANYDDLIVLGNGLRHAGGVTEQDVIDEIAAYDAGVISGAARDKLVIDVAEALNTLVNPAVAANDRAAVVAGLAAASTQVEAG